MEEMEEEEETGEMDTFVSACPFSFSRRTEDELKTRLAFILE